jgi:hypothetical protein
MHGDGVNCRNVGIFVVVLRVLGTGGLDSMSFSTLWNVSGWKPEISFSHPHLSGIRLSGKKSRVPECVRLTTGLFFVTLRHYYSRLAPGRTSGSIFYVLTHQETGVKYVRLKTGLYFHAHSKNNYRLKTGSNFRCDPLSHLYTSHLYTFHLSTFPPP